MVNSLTKTTRISPMMTKSMFRKSPTTPTTCGRLSSYFSLSRMVIKPQAAPSTDTIIKVAFPRTALSKSPMSENSARMSELIPIQVNTVSWFPPSILVPGNLSRSCTMFLVMIYHYFNLSGESPIFLCFVF